MPEPYILFSLLLISCLIAAQCFLFWKFRNRDNNSNKQAADASAANELLRDNLEETRKDVHSLRAAIDSSEAEKTKLIARISELETSLKHTKDNAEQQSSDIADYKEEKETKITQLEDEIKQAAKRESTLQQQLTHAKATLDAEKKAQGEAGSRFENLANEILEKKTARFDETSRQSISQVLNPLREQMSEFGKRINDSFVKHGQEQHTLKSEIERIVVAKDELISSTSRLTQALRGDSKTQGDWGEFVLQDLLNDAGLREGHDYTIQKHDVQFADPDNSETRRRPDVVVNLPDNKHIIIDSKVSLTNYEAHVSTANDARTTADPIVQKQSEEQLRLFINSVRKHIDSLSRVNYPAATVSKSASVVDFTIMFMPIEASWILANQHDRDLVRHAWNKNIAVVSPTTLFAVLRTIAHIWKVENYNANAKEIARRGGLMYNKIAGFVETMGKVGKGIEGAHGNFEAAMKQLSSGKGNILTQAEQLKQLGATTNKNIPAELIEGTVADDPEDESPRSESLFDADNQK